MNTLYSLIKNLILSNFILILFTYNAWAIPADVGPYKVGFSQISFIDTTRDVNQVNKPGEPNGRRIDVALYYPINDDVATTGINMIYSTASENLPLQSRSFAPIKSMYGAKVGVDSILPNLASDPTVNCFNTAIFNCTDSVISPLPVSNNGPFPLILYAHGSPGSNTMPSVSDQAEFFASHGYIVAAPSFMGNRFQDSAAGSCSSKPGGQRPCSGLKTADRPNDLSFTLNKLLEKNNTINDLLYNRIDTNNIGVYGYSAGVNGVIGMVAGGQYNDGSIAIKNSLVKAAAYGALGISWFGTGEINPLNISVPIMALIGTADPRTAALQLSYERINANTTQEKYLLLIKNMHHLGPSNSFCNLLSETYFKSYPLGNMTNFDISLVRLLFGFDATLPTKGGIQSICPSELFYDPINLSIITTLGLAPRLLPAEQIPGQFRNSIYTPTMLASEGQRITNKYLLAFFKAKLQNDMPSKHILVPGNVKAQEPEVLLKVCEAVGAITKCHSNMEEGNTLINPIAEMNTAEE